MTMLGHATLAIAVTTLVTAGAHLAGTQLHTRIEQLGAALTHTETLAPATPTFILATDDPAR